MNFPYKHFAGDTLDFPVSVPDYPASAGWTLKYFLSARFTDQAQASIVLTAITDTDGVGYRIQASPATTATWKPGPYGWSRRVEKGGGAAVQTLSSSDDQGEVLITADPSTRLQGYDSRSDARKALESLETAYQALCANPLMKSYSIGTRTYMRSELPQIITLIDRARNQVANEDAAAQVAAGLGNPRNIGVRFNRA